MMRSMFELVDADPPAARVRRITFVPFLSDGRVVLIAGPGGPALPSGEVADGEDYVLDTVLRVPLETAGFATSGSTRSAWTATTCTPGSRGRPIPGASRTAPSR